jgi:hypothetical protein
MTDELGSFLKARRGALTPYAVGLLTENPAIALGRRMDVLAWNEAATALFTDFAELSVAHRNYIRVLFTDPAVRALHVDWPHDARDADFRTWWAEARVNSASYGTKHYHHPVVGDLTLDCDVWTSPDGSGQRLMVLTAEPASPSYDALRLLTSWQASVSR